MVQWKIAMCRNARNFTRLTAALAALGTPLLAHEDYGAACRAAPEKFDTKRTLADEKLSICVCGYEVMADEMEKDRIGYIVTWMLSNKPFEEITSN